VISLGVVRLRASRGLRLAWHSLRPVLPALAAGLFLRYALAPFTSWPHDDVVWYQAAAAGQHHLGLYDRSQFPYPPVWGLLLQALGQAVSHVGVTGGVLATSDVHFAALDQATHAYSGVITGPWFNVAFKTILFAFDVGTGLMLRSAVRSWTGSAKQADLSFALWFLNPLTLFESAIFGGFDVVVAFFIMGTLLLLLQRRYLWAGVALGLGIFTKVSPVFLLPLAGLIAAEPRLRDWRLRINVQASFALVGGLAIAALLIGAPELLAGSGGAALHSTSARVQTGLNVGGLSLFGVRSIQLLTGIATWSSDHAGLVIDLTNSVAVLGSIVIALFALRWARVDRGFGILAGATLVIALVLLTQPLTQPQYMLWLLPEAIAVAVAMGFGRWLVGLLCVTPLVYVYSLFGPIAVLAPLAVSTGVVTPDLVASTSLAWFNAPARLWGDSLGGDFQAAAFVVTVIALGALIAGIYRRRPSGHARSRVRRAHPETRSGLGIPLVVAALATVLVSSIAAYAAPLTDHAAAVHIDSVISSGSSTQLRVTIRPGPGQSTVRLVAFPVNGVTPARTLEVVVDGQYPGPDSDLRTIQGVFDHLSADLRARGDARSVNEIDVPHLDSILRDLGSARSTAVVMTAGVMPTEVYSKHADILTPWLHAGGMLIWSGDAIGYYSEDPTTTFHSTAPNSLFDPGPAGILGSGIVQLGDVSGRVAAAPTDVARALGLRFDSTVIGLNLGVVGTTPLGFTGDGLSSITDVAVGAGNVLVLGGDSYDEQLISHDVLLILMSHVLDDSGSIVYLDVPAERASAGPVVWQPAVPLQSGQSLILDAFDPSDEGVAFISQVVAR